MASYHVELFRIGPNSLPGEFEESAGVIAENDSEAVDKAKIMFREMTRPNGPDGCRVIDADGRVASEFSIYDDFNA